MNVQTVPLDHLKEHPGNPRRHFDPALLHELAESLQEKGMLNPILARTNGKGFEILSGARRFRAAKLAEMAEVPVIVREMDDAAALEVMIVDNLQREGVHPLEEAAGYQQLLAIKGYDAARIAARIGRSVKYVYDRMKLTQLIPALRDVFLEGRITAGHAILLARLKPEDQKRAMGEKHEGYGSGMSDLGGLWQEERGLFIDRDEEKDPLKAVSVRELAAWIDSNVKLEPADVDQMVLPETAAKLKDAEAEGEKVLRITRSDTTHEVLKNGPKVILGRSWKRADGLDKSKTCEHSKLGQVVQGEGRGEAFLVCAAKQKCATHWPDQVKAAKKVEKVVKEAKAKGEDPEVARRKARELEEQRRKVEEERREKAEPAIRAALAAAVKKAPAGAGGVLGKLLIEVFEREMYISTRESTKLIPPGKTAEDLVRHLGLALLISDLEYGFDDMALQAKGLGVDVKKIVDQVAPPEKPEKPTSKKAKGKK